MSAILFLDVETTGLNPEIHGVHQIAGTIEVDRLIAEMFNFYVKPFDGCKIDTAALAISNTKRSALSRYKQEIEVVGNIETLVHHTIVWSNKSQRIHLAGWRAPEFDIHFFKKMFLRINPNVPHLFNQYFYEEAIDIKSIAASKLMDHRKDFKKFNLEEVARFLDIYIKEDELHTAQYDTYLAQEVYNKCINL